MFIDRRFPKKDKDFKNYKIGHLEEMLGSALVLTTWFKLNSLIE